MNQKTRRTFSTECKPECAPLILDKVYLYQAASGDMDISTASSESQVKQLAWNVKGFLPKPLH